MKAQRESKADPKSATRGFGSRWLKPERLAAQTDGVEVNEMEGGLTTMARVLVLYGTLEGQTAKISEYIAEVAKNLGYNAEAVNIAELPSGFPLEEYEAVIKSTRP